MASGHSAVPKKANTITAAPTIIFLHGPRLLAFRLGGFCAPQGPIRPPQPLPLRKGRVFMLTQDAGGVDVFHQLNPQFTPPHIRTKTREHALRLYGSVAPQACGSTGLWPHGAVTLRVCGPSGL